MTLIQEQEQVLRPVLPVENKRGTASRLHELLGHLEGSVQTLEKNGWRILSQTPATHPHVQAVVLEGPLSALDPVGGDAPCHVVVFEGGHREPSSHVSLDELIEGEDWHPLIWELLMGIRGGIEQFVPLHFTESQIESFTLQTCSQVRVIECACEGIEKALEDLQFFRQSAPELEDFSRVVKSLVEEVTPLLEPVKSLTGAFAKLREAELTESLKADAMTALNMYNFWTKLRMGEAKQSVESALEWARWLPRRLLLGLLYAVESLQPCNIKEKELWSRTEVFHREWKRLEEGQTLIDQLVGGLQNEVFHEELVQSLQPVRTLLAAFLQTWRRLWAHSLESRWIDSIHLDIKTLREVQADWNEFVSGSQLQNVMELVSASLDAQQYAGHLYEAVSNLHKVELLTDAQVEPERMSVAIRNVHEWNDYLFYQLGLLHRISETHPTLRRQLKNVHRVLQPLVSEVESFIDQTTLFLEGVMSGAGCEREVDAVRVAEQQYNKMFPDLVEAVKGELDAVLGEIKTPPKVPVAYALSYFSVREWLWQTLQNVQADHVLIAARGAACGYAQLAAMDLRPCRFYERTPAVVEAYTFGEVKFGDVDFVSTYLEKAPGHYHVTLV